MSLLSFSPTSTSCRPNVTFALVDHHTSKLCEHSRLLKAVIARSVSFMFSRNGSRASGSTADDATRYTVADVQTALERLRDGTASAIKYVSKIADTNGAGNGS